jgi:N,N'-diacetylchitobiose transport system substrate-binding protein
VVFEGSDNKPLAKAFVEFMVAPENVARYAENVPGYFPGTSAGIEETAATLGELYAPFAEMLLNHTRSYPLGAGWGALEGAQVFQNTMQQVLSGRASTEEALASLNDEMDAEF